MTTDLMARLAARSGLRAKFGLKFIDDPIWPYLDIQKPLGVARLVGEAKQSVQDGQVFLRGQTGHFQAMRPSLLRDVEADAVQVRRSAERELVTAIRSIRVKRFQRVDLPALLQHYGFQTTWLDVVDNLFVATWFATHELQPVDGFYRIVPSAASHGWLYLLCARPWEVRCVDLRRKHHPLSTRPHVQHGISLKPRGPGTVDLRRFVVATLRFPVAKFTTAGTLFENAFLVPPPSADHTLELLLKHKANKMAADAETRHRIPEGTLGRVLQCCHAA